MPAIKQDVISFICSRPNLARLFPNLCPVFTGVINQKASPLGGAAPLPVTYRGTAIDQNGYPLVTQVTIYINNVAATTTQSGKDGSFSGKLIIQNPGSYDLAFGDPTTIFTMPIKISVTMTPVFSDVLNPAVTPQTGVTPLTVTASGNAVDQFTNPIGATVTIYLDATAYDSVLASSSDGSFSKTLTPISATGNHVIGFGDSTHIFETVGITVENPPVYSQVANPSATPTSVAINAPVTVSGNAKDQYGNPIATSVTIYGYLQGSNPTSIGTVPSRASDGYFSTTVMFTSAGNYDIAFGDATNVFTTPIPISVGTTLGQDYTLFIEPYLTQINKILGVLMKPYTLGNQHYGYDNAFGMFRGGNIEPSPAIGVPGGYNDCIVGRDNNYEGALGADYWNAQNGNNTTIFQNTLHWDGMTWEGVGACPKPFVLYNYPSSFALIDRRDPMYGTDSPTYAIWSKPGKNIGGIGKNCGTQGQTWYIPGYDVYYLHGNLTNPLIVTEFPNSIPVGPFADLEELSFYIDAQYIQQGPSGFNWRQAFQNAMGQYPFPAPRQALHFLQCGRATAAWNKTGFTNVAGMTPLQMMQTTIEWLFTPATQIFSGNGKYGALGPDGGFYQSWGGGGSSDTPEPNCQGMAAWDPDCPRRFGN